jgi:N-acetylglutamate synthase-like GNAT family acetyltransferase
VDLAGALRFRSISAADVEAAASVFVECFSAPPWNEPWTLAAAVRRLGLFASAPTFRGVVATEEGRAVAMAAGQIEGWLEGNVFLIQELCVVPTRQHAGIGTQLLAHFLSELERNDGLEAVYLLIDAASNAESFYAARGFRRSERKIVLSRGMKAPSRSQSSNE